MMRSAATIGFVILCVVGANSFALAHPGHDHGDTATKPANLRTWKEASGVFELQASFVAAREGKVQLRKTDGKLVTLEIKKLSHEDQHWIEDRIEEIRKLNEQTPASRSYARQSVDESPSEQAAHSRHHVLANVATETLVAFAPEAKIGSGKEAITKAFEPFVKLGTIKTRADERFFYVESNGIPAHQMMVGITAWQQQVPLPQKYFGDNAWQIPLYPVPAKTPASAKNRFLRGAIALAVNGVPIFNPLNNRGDDAYLFGELDDFGGHCGRADDYHYHIAPVHLEKQLGKGSILAYALDGYPIYGYDEPDGSAVAGLDALNGHKDSHGHYHYHATKKYPYLNGGFYGEVVERDGQVDPQPRAQPLRPALPPLRDAKIVGFQETKPGSFVLTYDVKGKKGTVSYSLAADGSANFSFTDTNGRTTTESYSAKPRNRGIDFQPVSPPKKRPTENDEPRGVERQAGSLSHVPQLAVSSGSVDAKGFLSIDCTCDGAGHSPAVAWKDAPPGTKSFAVSLWHTAPDQEKSYWLVYNIPANTTSLPKNSKLIGTVGLNDRRRAEYDPMCSKGPGVKKYHLTVYALAAEQIPHLAPDKANRTGLLAAIKEITLATGTLDFQYERKK